MPALFDLKFDTRAFGLVERAVEDGCLRALHRAAVKTVLDSSAEAPIETGALKASHYVSSKFGSTYSHAAGAAAGLRTDATPMPEHRPHDPEKDVIVGVAQPYAAPVEFGAAGRPPRPFFWPALVNNLEGHMATEVRLVFTGVTGRPLWLGRIASETGLDVDTL